MWLGLSILSLIQGGTYMYQVVHENVINKKKSRQISTATPASVQAKVSAANSNHTNTEQHLDEEGNPMGIPPKNPLPVRLKHKAEHCEPSSSSL
uniref:Uncharacterized protein n=1 Tax=Ditylenchus dipsaci TaxID=166011 RepID=A0A915D2S3_9BILA